MKGFRFKGDDMITNKKKFPDGEEMPGNYEGKDYPKGSGKLMWRETILVKPSYDPEIENRSLMSHDVTDSNVTVTYGVVSQGLVSIKKRKIRRVREQGDAIILNERPLRNQIYAALGVLPAPEKTALIGDINSIRNYLKDTLIPAINNCSTVQEVKAVAVSFPDISK